MDRCCYFRFLRVVFLFAFRAAGFLFALLFFAAIASVPPLE